MSMLETAGLHTMSVTLTGLTPLLQHNIQLADPLSPAAKAMKVVSSKRGKTDADLEEMRALEIRGGLYWSDLVGVYVPSDWIEGTILGAARKRKLGPAIKAGVQVLEDEIPLSYDGRAHVTSPDDIVRDPEFAFVRAVVVQRARVMRARPIFRNWSLQATVAFDPEQVNRETLLELIQLAGIVVGIGDWRPKFGRFSVAV